MTDEKGNKLYKGVTIGDDLMKLRQGLMKVLELPRKFANSTSIPVLLRPFFFSWYICHGAPVSCETIDIPLPDTTN